MIVHCYGGLANRLRVILSYRARFKDIRVVWLEDEEIAGSSFLDVFHPLERVTFVPPGEVELSAIERTLSPCPDAPDGWQSGYAELTPLAATELGLLQARRPYSAVHVRRTDHVSLAKQCGTYTDDDAFRSWLKAAPSPIYVATDNAASQSDFLDYIIRTLGKDAIASDMIEASDHQRQTSLAQSVTDLFACAGSAQFMGSGESSFTNLIHTLRGMKGWWS